MREVPDLSVVLVSMPWATTTRPSLSLGLLGARVRARGFACDVLYANIFFSALVGPEGYEYLCNTPRFFGLAEHLFAVDLFGREALRSTEYLDSFSPAELADASGTADAAARDPLETFVTLRDRIVPAFLDVYTQDIVRRRPRVVGFTCTFNQVLASVALARRLKQADPSIAIVLGGPCVHGPMGVCYSRIFSDCVDAVFIGEADTQFPAYLERLSRGESVREIADVAMLGERRGSQGLLRDLDTLETPDYGDYFDFRARLAHDGFSLAPFHRLPFEASRGCWWGEKNHCTFCGLNNEGMAFRRKTPARVVAELTSLATRHATTTFMAADNILDFRAFHDLLPALADSPLEFDIFVELKTNLRRSHVEQLHRAGITWVQPGIESFSDHVLQLMRKGVSALQNVQTLKWLTEFGIRPSYNVLVGFPGETDDDYEALLACMQRLYHLPPPGPEAGLVQVQRFAPFHFDSDACGIGPIRGARFYDHLIPSSLAPKEDYAYFFDHDLPVDAPVFRQLDRVNAVLREWCEGSLAWSLQLAADDIRVRRGVHADGDAREPADVLRLDRVASAIVVMSDEIVAEAVVVATLAEAGLGSANAIAESISDLVREGLLLRHRGKLLCHLPFDAPQSQAHLTQWLTDLIAPAGARSAAE